MDVVSFCSNLIRRKSVTPLDDGAIDCISEFLSSIGFKTRIMTFKSRDTSNIIKNLFAEYGSVNAKSLGFIGHSDVVPAGDNWEVEPFSAVQKDDFLYGRGVADMKGGIAAFCCAVAKFVQHAFDGSIRLFIAGDEEVGSPEGMQALLKWAAENDRIPQYCLIGEPSSNTRVGDRVYLGHRGSLNVIVTSHGKQGHSAYPSNYKNSLSNLCRYITKISDYQWKHENKRFPKTNLEVTMLTTNNYAPNIVPDLSSANLNIRFGDDYTAEKLKILIQQEAKGFDNLSFDFLPSGEAYYCDNKFLKSTISSAISAIVGVTPVFSTAGGTSDGRFMVRYCEVVEFGLPDSTIHQKNERAKIADLKNLERIYFLFLKKYFE